MNRFDYYTGEPQNGSPGFSGSTNMNCTTGGLGQPIQPMQFSSDPNMRFQQTGGFINPGGMGYNQQYPYQLGYQQQPMMPTFFPQQPQGSIQFPNKFSIGNNYNPNGYNPALGLPGQQLMFAQPQYQDSHVHVPGFNMGSTTLYSQDVEQMISDLQFEMSLEMEQAIIERNKRFQGYFNSNFGNNYYGMPYYNNYLDQNVLNKYRRKG